MHRLFATLVAAATIVAVAPAHAATRGFRVGGFDRIHSAGPFVVRVRTGAAPSARATGEQEQLDRLEVMVRGGELRIGTKPGWNWRGLSWRSRKPAVIDVTVPGLRAATLTGSGDMTIDRVRTRSFDGSLTGSGDLVLGQLVAERVGLSLTGSGDVTATGRATSAALSVRGSGTLQLDALTVQDATVDLMGSGDIVAAVARSAQGNLMGSGDVRIVGRARCQITKRGSGDVTCG